MVYAAQAYEGLEHEGAKERYNSMVMARRTRDHKLHLHEVASIGSTRVAP